MPEGLRDILRASFATEVADRLPRIMAMEDLDAVRRDVHTLASSAVVVGEPELAAAARAAEQDLNVESVGRLADALRAWTP